MLLSRLYGIKNELDAETALLRRAFEIEARVPCMMGHSARVSQYSVALAERIGMSDKDQQELRLAGIVHDIGKIGVPVEILLRNGPLSPEERQLVQIHPRLSEELCGAIAGFERILPMIRHHHERLDGSGYPDGLRGSRIPLGALILQTADMFDALSEARPYREALAPEDAFHVLRQEARRGWRDASLIEEFYQIICVSRLYSPSASLNPECPVIALQED